MGHTVICSYYLDRTYGAIGHLTRHLLDLLRALEIPVLRLGVWDEATRGVCPGV